MPHTRSGARGTSPPSRALGTGRTKNNRVKPRPLGKVKGSSSRSTRSAPSRSTKKVSASHVDMCQDGDSDEDDLPGDDDAYMAFLPDSDDSASDDSDSDEEIVHTLAGKVGQSSNKRSTSAEKKSVGRKRVRMDKDSMDKDSSDELPPPLDRQLANNPPLPVPSVQLGGIPRREDHGLDETLPTIENYKGLVKEWPRWRISSVQNKQKKGTSVPPKILAEAKAIKKLYKHHKRLLSMMGSITPYTLDKSLGELGGTRFPDAYRLWLKFSVEARKQKMPRRGGPGKLLSQRNRKLGATWKALSALHKQVFHPRIFYTLSGLPSPNSNNDTDDEEEGPIMLSPEDRAELQAVYDETVCSSKVRKVYAKTSAGVTEGRTLPDYNRRSLKCVEKLNNQIENESNRMDFGYYFLVSSTHAATGGDLADPGWCREYTSNKDLADYVRSKSNFPTIFAAQTQGISVDKVISSTIGKKERKSCVRKDPGDKVKSDLAALLKSELGKVLKFDPPGFPRGHDPGALLLGKGWRVKIKQLPGSSLPPDVLKLGFNAMNSRRSLWLKDLQAGLFRFEKMPDDEDSTNLEDDGTGNMDGLVENDLEEEEWNGLGDDGIGEAE